MKTFESFLYEGVGDKLGKMSDEEFAKFQKGRTAAEAEGFRDAREKARGKGGALAVRKKEKEKTAGLGGGALALRDKKKFGPADKGGALVKKKAGTITAPKKPFAKPVADERQAGSKPGTSRGRTQTRIADKTYDADKPKPQETKKKRACIPGVEKRDANGNCVRRDLKVQVTRDVDSIEADKLNY